MYTAARAAVQVAAGQNAGNTLGDSDRAGKRGQTLKWLRADLDVITNLISEERTSAKPLSIWQNNSVMASVSDPSKLAELPDAERKDWERLWTDVAALLAADPAK